MYDLVDIYFEINGTLTNNDNLIIIPKLDFAKDNFFKLSEDIFIFGHVV